MLELPVEMVPRSVDLVPRSHDEKRAILLSQHRRLRGLIDGMSRLAEATLATPLSTPLLAEQVAQLRAGVEAHLRDEEAFLVPILGRLDAWGPLRLELLHVEHAHQRAVLAALAGAKARGAPELLAHRAIALAADLLADMEAEEAGILDPAALRDDVAVIDQSGD